MLVTFKIVKSGRKYFEAHGYIDGQCQGAFDFDHIEARLIETVKTKYKNCHVIAS